MGALSCAPHPPREQGWVPRSPAVVQRSFTPSPPVRCRQPLGELGGSRSPIGSSPRPGLRQPPPPCLAQGDPRPETQLCRGAWGPQGRAVTAPQVTADPPRTGPGSSPLSAKTLPVGGLGDPPALPWADGFTFICVCLKMQPDGEAALSGALPTRSRREQQRCWDGDRRTTPLPPKRRAGDLPAAWPCSVPAGTRGGTGCDGATQSSVCRPRRSGCLRGQWGQGGEWGTWCSVLAQHLSSPAEDGCVRGHRLRRG